MTNEDRADRGEVILEAHAAQFGPREYDGDNGQSQLGDILADLMHYAADQGLDFDAALSMGTDHYGDETS